MVCFPRDLRVNLLVHHGLLVGRRIAGISPQSEVLFDQPLNISRLPVE
jgi:hypothetical protein